jgi:hypothetical protein
LTTGPLAIRAEIFFTATGTQSAWLTIDSWASTDLFDGLSLQEAWNMAEALTTGLVAFVPLVVSVVGLVSFSPLPDRDVRMQVGLAVIRLAVDAVAGLFGGLAIGLVGFAASDSTRALGLGTGLAFLLYPPAIGLLSGAFLGARKVFKAARERKKGSANFFTSNAQIG